MSDQNPHKRKSNTSGDNSSPKKACSPYKAMARRNSDYCGYVSMCQLEPHKAYLIYQINHTEHEKYGPGELAFIKTNNNIKQRVQLPSKYLKTLTDDEIDQMKLDVQQDRCPYLVFRKRLADKSFHIDVLPNCPEMQDYHKTWTDVPDIKELSFMNLNSSTEDDIGTKDDSNNGITEDNTNGNTGE